MKPPISSGTWTVLQQLAPTRRQAYQAHIRVKKIVLFFCVYAWRSAMHESWPTLRSFRMETERTCYARGKWCKAVEQSRSLALTSSET